MPKRAKITLYAILILATISVIWLMLGNTNPNVEIQNDTDIETLTGENLEVIPETVENEAPTFEEDVMKDLEGFFNDNNGYEDIQGEFGFTKPGNE